MEFKRCSGHKGHWECGKDYPDHMVPTEEFTPVATYKSGVDTRCRRCNKFYKKAHNPQSNPKRKVWYGLAGSQKEYYSLSKEGRAKIRVKANNVEWKFNGAVVDITPRFKSEFGPSKPMTKRESKVVEGEKVPEGWVYIVQNPDVPWVLKIGKTWPDGIREIMSSARRFGRSELVYKFQFAEALKAEQAVHAILHYCNLRTLGYDDCGMELFKCTLEEAIDAINKVYSENDRPSLAVGE